VLVISSELPELLGICDRIYALSAGRITGEVARADATQERLMQFMTQTTQTSAARNTAAENTAAENTATPTAATAASRAQEQSA
jgi:ABC-type methionine transport system ATPase subunit